MHDGCAHERIENVTSKSTFWKVSLGKDSFNRTLAKGEMPVLYFALYNPQDDATKIIKSQDFNVSLSDADDPSSTAPKGSAASTISDGPARTGSGSDDDDDNLSAGAGAGIAVGATLGVLALAGIGFFLWRRMRRPEPQYQQPQHYQQYQQYNVPPPDPKQHQSNELVGHYQPQQQQQQQQQQQGHIYEAP